MATAEQLTPDEHAVFVELEQSRCISKKELSHDFLQRKLSGGESSQPNARALLAAGAEANFKAAAGRLARYFNLTKSNHSLLQDLSVAEPDHSSLEALSLDYGPEPENSGSLGGYRKKLLESDYNY